MLRPVARALVVVFAALLLVPVAGDGPKDDRDKDEEREEREQERRERREQERAQERAEELEEERRREAEEAQRQRDEAQREGAEEAQARERGAQAAMDAAGGCPADVSVTAKDGGDIIVRAQAVGPVALYRAQGDAALVHVATLGPSRPEYRDEDTTIGDVYTYTFVAGDTTCATVETTAIPVFPSIVAAAAAMGVALAGRAVVGRRR